MRLSQACHRHEKCSVNACPLETSAVETDPELNCPLSDFDIEKIKERYNRIKNHPIVKPETEPLPNLNLRSKRMRDTNGQLFRANTAQREKN